MTRTSLLAALLMSLSEFGHEDDDDVVTPPLAKRADAVLAEVPSPPADREARSNVKGWLPFFLFPPLSRIPRRGPLRSGLTTTPEK